MKKALFILGFIMATVAGANAQTQTGPVIDFDKDVHDYGTIEQHSNGVCEFTITNTGTEPLIISQAKGSCGCTVPSYEKEPIMPGSSSTIQVKYDTKRVGPINKSVTISSNAVNAPTKVLRIKGTVTASETGATSPVKESSGAPVAN